MVRPTQFLVLLVDDESVVRMATTAGVEEAGREFVDAASLDDALDVLHRRSDIGDVAVPGRFEKADIARLVRERWLEVRLVVTSRLPIPSDQVPAESRSVRKMHHVGQVTQAINGFCGWVGSLGPRFP